MGRRVSVTARAAAPFRGVAVAVLSLCAICGGCDNSCVAFVSNPSGGNISISTSTCHISTQANGNVRVGFSAPSDRVESWHRAGIEHAFVTVREIDARLSVPYGEDSEGWRELAPDLKKRPVQIDLMSGTENSSAANFLREATIPAGEYTQVRMLLVADSPAAQEAVPEENACSEAGFNCVVAGDGDIHPLALRTGGQILVLPGGAERAVFHVFPGTATNLDLEFDPDSSQVYMVGGGVWLNPAFVAHCGFPPASKHGPGD